MRCTGGTVLGEVRMWLVSESYLSRSVTNFLFVGLIVLFEKDDLHGLPVGNKGETKKNCL